MKASASKPKDGHTDDDFDPTQVTIVGVKMAAGDGSKEVYKGPVFVDEVDWQ